jgi:malonyl-CoA/methylmalonyl-CoA synthetase
MANLFFDEIMSAGADAAPVLRAPSGIAWSYAEMRREAARMAHALVAKGVKPGDRVAAQIEKSPRGLTLYLGTVMAGGIFLPLNTAYTTGELDYFLGDAEPSVVVCDPAKRDDIARIAGAASVETPDADGHGSMADAAAAAGDGFAPVARAADDLAAILYTSGTTGRSKGAMLTHANLVSNAIALAQIWRFTANDVLLHALPIYHTHGLFVACNTVMRAGASMIFLPKFEPGAMLREMADATVMMGVPTFYTRLLDTADFTKERAAHMRLFVSGSAPLLAETHREWTERTGHAILERYGMTETNMNTSNPYDGERRPGTVGFPLPDVALRIADPESGRDLGREEIGVIEVKGPNVFKGYWRMPEKTAAEFRPDGFFVTGDLGKVDADGYVHIVGRGKDLIISGGFNVYPKEVELEIDALDGVLESAVIGLPHRDFGEGVAAVVVPRPGATLDEAAILKGLEGKLAKFKLPKRVMVADELPRNTMGKVQKAALREQHKDVFG